jgi:MFS family permease
VPYNDDRAGILDNLRLYSALQSSGAPIAVMSTIVETTSRLSTSLRHTDEDIIPLGPLSSQPGSVALPKDLAAQASLTGDDGPQPAKAYTRLRQCAVVTQLAGVNFTTSASQGLVVIGLPAITKAINLPADLAFWPASVTSLATASTLLLAGAIADVTSPRMIGLLGCLLTGVFMLACGAVQTGEQMVVMRALQGLGSACHFAASISLITAAVPSGRGRNIAFATWGLSQPLGFSFGLVLGGVLVETLGWRAGFFLYGGLTMVLLGIGVWALPTGVSGVLRGEMGRQLKTKVDWIGAGLASAAMTFASYLCAYVGPSPIVNECY